MRVGIVGAGPKGLFAVERLVAHHCGGPLLVTVFDPSPPGRGAAYDPRQPAWLRLNVAATIVDAGWRTGPHPTAAGLPTFDQWRRASGSVPPLDPFPPRALVGEYLDAVWTWLVASAPAGVRLRHVPVRIDAVEPAEPGWILGGELQDEVLLASGHATDWTGALRHSWRGSERLVPAVYPIGGLGGIGPGDSVAVRGAALTFIDAALALTEGRGGRFTGAGNAVYRTSGTEPRVLWPTSRSGRWMEVKPEPGSRLATLDRSHLVRAASDRLAAAPRARTALEQVATLARQLLALADAKDGGDVASVLAGEPDGDATEALRRSWEVATGRRRPGAAWAVGQAWRDLYPALVGRFSGTGDPDGFTVFAAVARRLERVAFGPPPVNAAKLLALIEAGVVDPSSLAGATATAAGFAWSAGAGPRADAVVDAVLPPPGAALLPDSLPGRLVADGVLATGAGRRGLAVDADATCLTPDGSRIAGLAAIGRPTEDVTIGNDTLSRLLHPATEHWAARVAAKVAVA